jgi:hypothetical protein
MPQAVPAVIIAAGSAIAAGAITTGIIIGFVVNVALAYLSEALAKKPRDPGRPPVNVTINDAVEYRHLVVGTRRVGGSFVYVRTSGSANKYLWYVIAYADHQCNALGDAWFDEFEVPSADINAGTGAVSTTWANGKLWIWNHLGTQAQTADAQLTAEFTVGADYVKWVSTDRLRGVCYRVIKMERDDVAFPTGAPNYVSAIVDGAKVYDPRLDSTNGGSGTHRMDDPSTWAFSHNWALNTLWLLTGGSVVNDQASRLVKYGLKEDYSRIDWPFWVAAANIADQSVSGANAPPSGAQVRYTLDMEFSCSQTRQEILDAAIAAGAGELVYVHGKWRLYAGAYDAPVHSFDQDDLRGEMEIEDTTDEKERVNRVAALFVDSASHYLEQTTPFRFNAAYDTQDGSRELTKELELLGVTDGYRAQRICELQLRRARQMRRVVFRFGRSGMKVAPFETFSFSHSRLGWSSREFRCVKRSRERAQDGGVITVITALTEDSSIYTDLLTADYNTGTSTTNAIQSEPPEAPTALTATPHVRAVEFNWTLGAFWTLHGITELWGNTTDSFGSATKIWEGRGTRVVVGRDDLTIRYYWVRVRTIGGQTSDSYPATNGVQARPLDAYEEAFFDSFEHQDYARFYTLRSGTPTITYPANGESGGRVLSVQGQGWFGSKGNIPYDPEALYMMTIKARQSVAGTAGANESFYAGVECFAADGTTNISTSGANTPTASQHYFCRSNFDLGAGASIGDWQIFRGYLSGLDASPGPMPAPDPSSPCEAYGSGGTVTKFIRPMFIANLTGGTGTVEIDYIRIDRVKKTEDIGPNATTEPIGQTENAAAYTVPSPGSAPIVVDHDLLTLAFTPADAGELKITGDCSVEVTGHGGAAGVCFLQLVLDGTVEYEKRITTAVTDLNSASTHMASIFASVTAASHTAILRIQSRGSGTDPGQALSVTNRVLRVEVNKR